MNQPTAATSVRPAELNERAIKDAKPGDVLRDAKISGLHLRCFAENKVFYLYYRTKAGVERRPQLGRHGSITLAQARKVAQDMLALVAAGQDPAQLRYDARDEPVLDDLWAAYWKRRGSANKSGGYDEYNYKRFLQPRFGQRKLSNVRYQDVAEMMDALKDTPRQANIVAKLLSRTTGTITGIKSPAKLWRAVRKEAGCENLRIHDLRHSFASAAISAGYTLAQIGELLGHKSTQTTKRYAHLVEEAAHAAATITADRIVAGMRKEKAPV